MAKSPSLGEVAILCLGMGSFGRSARDVVNSNTQQKKDESTSLVDTFESYQNCLVVRKGKSVSTPRMLFSNEQTRMQNLVGKRW